jgi:hypothetical protein
MQISGTFGKERGPGQQIILPGLVTRHPHPVLDPGRAKDALRRELDVTHVQQANAVTPPVLSPSLCVTVDPTA